MGRQEQMILDELFEAKKEGREVKYWKLLYKVVKKYSTPGETLRDHFVQVVALCNKLVKEKKIARDRRNKKNNVVLTQFFFDALTRYGQDKKIPDGSGGNVQETVLHGKT